MTIYSYSRLSTYETCPLQYKLHYIDGITAEEEYIEAFMGTRVHETLEKLYADLILSKMNTVEELVDHYKGKWSENWHDGVIINRKDMTPEDYRRTGEKAIREYYARYHPFDQSKTLWTEGDVQFSLGGDEYRLTGVIDRLERTKEGVYEIHDYKGSKRLPTKKNIDQDRQLALYQLAVQEAFPDAENIALVWHYVLFDTELRSSRTKDQLEELKGDYRDLIDEIEAAEDFPPKETPLCAWCGYWEHCPNKKHLVKIGELPAGEREIEKGYVLVDRYTDLKEQEEMLGQEMEEVKEELVRYARENDIEVVRGTKKRARISIKSERKLPSKSADDERYEEMVRRVKDAGIWDRTSALDTRKLARDLDSGALPEELSKELKNFVTEQEKTRITLSKLREGDVPDE